MLRDILESTRQRYGFLLLAYAIMPDHLHAIVVPSSRDTISSVMRYIKGAFARAHNVLRGSDGAVWQPRFYECAVGSEEELGRRIEYIEENP